MFIPPFPTQLREDFSVDMYWKLQVPNVWLGRVNILNPRLSAIHHAQFSICTPCVYVYNTTAMSGDIYDYSYRLGSPQASIY
jgi:hypothetical protein